MHRMQRHSRTACTQFAHCVQPIHTLQPRILYSHWRGCPVSCLPVSLQFSNLPSSGPRPPVPRPPHHSVSSSLPIAQTMLMNKMAQVIAMTQAITMSQNDGHLAKDLGNANGGKDAPMATTAKTRREVCAEAERGCVGSWAASGP